MANETVRKYKTIVSAIGKQKIANATLNGTKVNITQAAVGDGGGAYYLPHADMTALVAEKWRGDIAGKWINEQYENMIDVKIVLPTEVGGFTVREAALYDEDGDLIVICNMPDTEKVTIVTGSAGQLTILIHIVLTDADTVEIKIDPRLDVVTAEDVERMIRQHQDACRRDLLIPKDGWMSGAEEAPDKLYMDIEQADVTERMLPCLTVLPQSLHAANACGMLPICRTLPGIVRLYADRQPETEIYAVLTLSQASSGSASGVVGGDYVLPTATATRLGGVKIGDGVSVKEDGRISVDAPGILADTVASDGDAEAMLDDVFNGTTSLEQ